MLTVQLMGIYVGPPTHSVGMPAQVIQGVAILNPKEFQIVVHKEVVIKLLQDYLNTEKLKNSITISSIRMNPEGTVVVSCIEDIDKLGGS